MEHVSKYEDMHEDFLMKWFHRSFGDYVLIWFKALPKGGISSFADLIWKFRESWDPSFITGSDPFDFLFKEEDQVLEEEREERDHLEENVEINHHSSYDPTTSSFCVDCDINTSKDRNLENNTESLNHEDVLSPEIIDERPAIESCIHDTREYSQHEEALEHISQ